MKLLAIISPLLAFQAVALVVPDTHAEHERRDVETSLYEKRSRLHQMKLPVRIGLIQDHAVNALDMLMDTIDEASANFGRRYGGEELRDLFAPSGESAQAVREWLASANIDDERISHSHDLQWIEFESDTSELEKLLHTEYWIYQHPETGKAAVGCDKYHLPKHVRGHVDFITPGVNTLRLHDTRDEGAIEKRTHKSMRPKSRPMPFPVRDTLGADPKEPCSSAITPDCVKKLYHITDKNLYDADNRIGIYENDDFLRQKDMNLFFTHYFPTVKNGTFPTLMTVDGAPKLPNKVVGYSSSNGDVESCIDFQLAYPLVYPNEIDLYQVDDLYWEVNAFGQGRYGLFNTFLDALDKKYCNFTAFNETGDDPKVDPIYPDKHKGEVQNYKPSHWRHPVQCGVYKPPGVISMSYSFDEHSYPENYLKRQCLEFAKLVLTGTTIVVSSGDEGVQGKNGCLGKNMTAFSPLSPSGCPAVLSVGATELPANRTAGVGREQASSTFPSGGGFSNYFRTPRYQRKTVANYLKNYNPGYKSYNISAGQTIAQGGGLYNRGGRGYPDVSAIGVNIAAFQDGEAKLLAGTSAAAPVFASIIARINAYRLKAGKKTVGFIHPYLYDNPDVFNDILNGTNPGCSSNGFSCVKGWDPLTGLGTPDYPKLKALLLGIK